MKVRAALRRINCSLLNSHILVLQLIAQLLGSTTEDLEGVLCNRSMGSAARKSVYTIPLTPEDVRSSLSLVGHDLTLHHHRRDNRAIHLRRFSTKACSIG